MKKHERCFDLAVGDRVKTQNGEVHTVIRVEYDSFNIPYLLSNNLWYTYDWKLFTIPIGAITDPIIEITGPIIEKLPPVFMEEKIHVKQYTINLTITDEEVELMRNCLSDLQKSGMSLNLKLANALIDAGYHK